MDNIEYWRGNDEYHRRNVGRVECNEAFFSKALYHFHSMSQKFMHDFVTLGSAQMSVLGSIVEFGAGRGENLSAIHRLLPKVELWAVEVNEFAAQQINVGNVLRGTMFDTAPPVQCDLAFTKGVLIHIPPEKLPDAYDVLYRASRRYILVVEYFNPVPVEVEYRGQTGLMWKRDFAGEMLDRFPDLTVVDYGFAWKRMTGQDNLNWTLMEKAR